MKNLIAFLLSLGIFVSINAQTVFTEALATGGTVTIQIINDELYGGSWNAGSLSKVPLDDPNNVTLVSEDFGSGQGPWKMVYDPTGNDMYVGTLGFGVYKLDLDDPLPVTKEFISNFGVVDGMIIHEGKLYVSGTNLGVNGVLYSMDLDIGGSSFQLEYESPDESIRSPLFYNNILYYSSRPINSSDPSEVLKIDLNDSNPTPELICTMSFGTVQSSLLAGSYSYFGVEGDNRIFRLNLNDTNFPLSEEIILENLDGGVIAFARDGNRLFFNNNFDVIMVYEDPNLNQGEINELEMALFPNPSGDILYLIGKTKETLQYNILTMRGQLLSSGYYASEGIDISNLTQGLYFLNITAEVSEKTMKFIKE